MSFRRDESTDESTQLFTNAKTFHRIEYSWLLIATAPHYDYFMTTRYFVPRCLLKHCSVKLSSVRVNEVVVVESAGKSFYVLQFE